jgi:hypothetical protein
VTDLDEFKHYCTLAEGDDGRSDPRVPAHPGASPRGLSITPWGDTGTGFPRSARDD